MSGSASGNRGGTPSITTPIAGPWLSPQVVKRNSVPNELPAISEEASGSCPSPPAYGGRGRGPGRRPGGVRWAAPRSAILGSPHLTLTLSAPRGGEGATAAPTWGAIG